jgi:hypothetical protein
VRTCSTRRGQAERGDRNDRRRHRENAREEASVAINSEEIVGAVTESTA